MTGGDVGFLVNLDDRLKQRITKKQKSACGIDSIEAIASGARGVFVSDRMGFRCGTISIGSKIIEQTLK